MASRAKIEKSAPRSDNLNKIERLTPKPVNILGFKFSRWRNRGLGEPRFDWETALRNEQAVVSIRRVVHTELVACATAINRNDKKEALAQLSEATAKLKRLAGGLATQFG